MLNRILFALLIGMASNTALAIEWQAPLLKEHPMVGHIYDLKNQQRISEESLYEKLKKTPLVLIGEKHDNPDHQQLEARILEALLKRPSPPAVVFEMLNEDQQTALKNLPAGITEAELKAQLKWPEKGWPWSDYGPLFLLSHQQQAPVVAGNISRTRISNIYQQQMQALTDERFNTLPAIPQPVREQIHDEIHRNHCELLPRAQLQPMLNIQLARDASMAAAMLEHRTLHGAVLIAGGFHVRKQLSVPLHLRARAADLQHAVVLLAEVDTQATRPSDYATDSTADYLWLTPAQVEKDHCAEMRKAMQQKHLKPD